MLSGTFREWVDDGAWGEWSYQHSDGAEVRVSRALVDLDANDEEEREMYEVYSDHTVAPDLPMYFTDEFEVVNSGHVTWETPGEVING